MSSPYQPPQTTQFSTSGNQGTIPPATVPPVASNGGFFGHPWGLFILFIVEMWERFSYYGMRALLTLYLIRSSLPATDINNFSNPGGGWSKGDASLLYGWYTGFVYLLPVFGGLIADRLIGTHRSMVLGGILIAMGHVVLSISGMGEYANNDVGMSLFIFGLGLIIFGTGHFKPCVTAMVGQLYDLEDKRRDGAFTIFYIGVNTGAFLGITICGYLGEKRGWHYGFGAAAIGMVSGLLVYFLLRPKYLHGVGEPRTDHGWSKTLIWIPIAIIASGIAAYLFHIGTIASARSSFGQFAESYPNINLIFKVIVLVVVLVSAIFFVSIQEPQYRGPVASIFIFMIFNAFFWCAFEQAGTSLNFFADNNTQLQYFNWDPIPVTWLQDVNPIAIMVLGPVAAATWTFLGKRNMNPSQPVKIGLALLLMGLGYIVMVYAGHLVHRGGQGTKVSILFLTITYIIHTVGELFISPTALAYITKAAPAKFMSLLIGFSYISNSIAQIIGGLIAAKVDAIERGEVKLPWDIGGQADFFMLFVVSSISAGIIALVLTPFLKKLMPASLR